jgi:hypothetical protein
MLTWFREGLINSRFHSEICSWAGHQGEFGGHPLFRGSLVGHIHRSMAPSSPLGTRSLRSRHEPSPRHVQIR